MRNSTKTGGWVALVGNPSADLYGSDRMVLESVRGLVRAGWRIVVAASVDGPLRRELERAGAEFVTVPVPVVRRSNLSAFGLLRLARDAARGIWPMVRLVRRVRPDVVYVNTVTVPLWPVVGRVLGCKVVVHVHEAESSASAVAKWGLSLPTRLADLVICNSETSRQVTVQSGGRASSIVVVPNGVAGPERVVPAREEVDGPRLVLVGRVSPRKGTDIAVRAIRMLHDRGVRARLDVVGDVFPGYEWYEREVRNLAVELGVSDSVTFSGFTPDVWPHLAAADVALVTSRQDESFGNGVVEAALAARPVVVSDHSGLREASQGLKSAVLVRPDVPDEIADAVEKVLADWTAHRLAAVCDSETAAQQRSPARYRAQVRAELEGLLQD